jgi:hypothetical protein
MAAQVVDFVLDDARRPPGEHSVDRLAVLVQRLDAHGPVTGNHSGEAGNAEASLVEADPVVVFDRLHGGVHEYGERKLLALPVRTLVVAQVGPLCWAILKHCELKGDADLRCGETDAGGPFQGCSHLSDEVAQWWGVQRGRFDRIGGAAQDRVTALNDRERVVLASEGNCFPHAAIPLIGSEHSWCIEPQPTLLDDEATVLDVKQSGVLTDGACLV